MSLKDALRRVLVKDNLPKVSKAVKELTSTTVLVGFPATTSMRAGDGKATNAMIAYVHDKLLNERLAHWRSALGAETI